MNEQYHNYKRIAEAIEYIRNNFKEQPDLDKIAGDLGLSPFHFQRLFSEWAGISPKKFLQFTSLEYSKSLLKKEGATLFDAAYKTGLSGTGRLHDLFVNIEGMTPGEYKNEGSGLRIQYHSEESMFGTLFIASTDKGICRLVFEEDTDKALKELQQELPYANYVPGTNNMQQKALQIFSKNRGTPAEIKLHLKGTDFQIKVWQALLNIPFAELDTYGSIAGKIGNAKASRAVGTAIGDNPVAFIIPCHRVVQSNGNYGEYRWGSTRKKMLIGWEASERDARSKSQEAS
ncbi:MAG: methylated-DNA--[protein]-cysteine S-methyltransferase [Bacteroidia bacterium]|nr:methylated-DNA--[protein]-cysteine S-methyltransferase [Bacteroidia bacterium]